MRRTKQPTGAAKSPETKEPSKAGRKNTLLDAALIAHVETLLMRGRTDKDVCELNGISRAVFYHWLQVGQAVKTGEPMPSNATQNPAQQALCMEFLDGVTRGRAAARASAIDAVMKAIRGADGKETTETTFSEVRINPKTGKRYTYRRVTKSTKIIEYQPNPQIALEYLQRRDKAEWSVRSEQVNIDFDVEIIRAIQAGEVDYPALLDEFKNEAQVRRWFKEAGIAIPEPDEEAD